MSDAPDPRAWVWLLPTFLLPASIKIEDKADESPRSSVPGLNLDSQNLDQTVMQRWTHSGSTNVHVTTYS